MPESGAMVPDGLVGPLAQTQVELTAKLALIRQRATLQQPAQCAVLSKVLRARQLLMLMTHWYGTHPCIPRSLLHEAPPGPSAAKMLPSHSYCANCTSLTMTAMR